MLQRAALRGPEYLRDLEADLAAGEANPQAHLEARLIRLVARSPTWTVEEQQRIRELSELALVDPTAALERLRSSFRGTVATRRERVEG